MILQINPNSAVPVYAQIVRQIKQAISSGVLRPGEGLPSLRDTAKALRVNPNTVVKAYRELEVQGVVCTEHGRGTYVTAGRPFISATYRAKKLEQLADAFLVEAYHLGASPEEITEALQLRLSAMRDAFDKRPLPTDADRAALRHMTREKDNDHE